MEARFHSNIPSFENMQLKSKQMIRRAEARRKEERKIQLRSIPVAKVWALRSSREIAISCCQTMSSLLYDGLTVMYTIE